MAKVETIYDSEKAWSVWVGGVEVNDYYLTFYEATELSMQYTHKGYTDVCIQKIKELED
jgi:hypothetical protein